MATALPSPMGDDPDFVAEIAKLEEEAGPLSAAVIETRWRLRLQAHRCVAGDHAYTWSGQIIDLPGGSPHQVMVCAYAAVHDDGIPSPRLIGPLHSPENAAKRLWSEQELKENSLRT
jgi:hypothetical protein